MIAMTGLVDECKCFHCDGGLKNWEPTDEPWTEHAKWFPRCEWLIQQRGQAFIAHDQQVNPPPISTPVSTSFHFVHLFSSKCIINQYTYKGSRTITTWAINPRKLPPPPGKLRPENYPPNKNLL